MSQKKTKGGVNTSMGRFFLCGEMPLILLDVPGTSCVEHVDGLSTRFQHIYNLQRA